MRLAHNCCRWQYPVVYLTRCPATCPWVCGAVQVVQAAQKLGVEAAKAAEKLDKAFNKGMSLLQKYTGKPATWRPTRPRTCQEITGAPPATACRPI